MKTLLLLTAIIVNTLASKSFALIEGTEATASAKGKMVECWESQHFFIVQKSPADGTGSDTLVKQKSSYQSKLLKISKAELDKYFVKVVTPEDSGFWKPDLRMFTFAALELGIDISECFIIGDDVDKDIVPAQKLGIGYFHITKKTDFRMAWKALGLT